MRRIGLVAIAVQQSPVSPPTWGPHPDSPMETLHRSMELKSPTDIVTGA